MATEAFFGCAGAVAVLAAALSVRSERAAAVPTALLLMLGWVLYVGPWHGYGLHVWSKALARWSDMPVELTNGGAWAMEDSVISIGVVGLYVVHGKRWLLVIWAAVLAEITFEVTYDWAGDGVWGQCELALDSLYLFCCAVLCVVGGGGHLRLLVDRRRRGRRQAHLRAVTRGQASRR